MISVSVVICCYTQRRRRSLAAATEAALGQLGRGDELILVVDHNDELFDELRAGYDGRLTVERNRFTRGLSGARNTGLEVASGDVIVFLDDDATMLPSALDAVRSTFVDQSITAMGGAVHPDWQSGARPSWFPPEFGWVVGCDYRGLPADGGQIRNPIGAAMAVRRDNLADIGGFSDRLGRVGTLPTGCEETMMGIELIRSNPQSRIVRRTSFAVMHEVPSDRATVSYFVQRCFHEGRSKAILTRLVGQGSSLESERAYTTKTLPSGVRQARKHPARVLALVTGLVVTAVGYVVGLAQTLRTRESL